MSNHRKIVLGITGEIGSGKTTVAKYLRKKYKADYFKFSDMLRDLLQRLYLEESRKNMQQISTLLRKMFGEDLMAKVIAQDIENSKSKIIVAEAMRRPIDAKYLRKLKNFYILAINTDAKKRYKRLTKRSENPDDKNKTLAQFKKESQWETEITIRQIMKKADFQIDNNSSFQNLYKQINTILENL